ncbi:MAG TPA: ATP-binding protein [Candidatus Saccharimonadales bacterium]|nr:ATP-binding protein [Candidatus Saccharimonadales bacterium]
MNKQPAKPSFSLEEELFLAEALFNSIGDGAITTDEFGKITRINTRTLDILGYKESEVLGSWFPKKIIALTEDGKPINLIERPITKAFLTGKPIFEKMYYRKKNGQIIPVAVTVSPIILKGRPVGAIEVFRDITLEHEMDRMKSDFISLASHQLRTPLSSIKTYTHMLIDGYMGELNGAQKKSLRTVIEAANRMNELISTLLNVTRIESGNIAITNKPVELANLVREVNKEHALLAAERGIHLLTELPPKANSTVKSDSLILKEVISNLVTNAIKYTPAGGQIVIRVRPRRNDIITSVEDTGLGIPRYSQDQVFTKFFRAPNVIQQETSGIGLGLYLVRGLLENLGGDIWFESEEGKGTSFFFSLPKSKLKSKPAKK